MASALGSDHLCPGILHAVPALDGLLMRVRFPGGLITAAQLEKVSQASQNFCAGAIDLTARANLQLRGMVEADLPLIVQSLRQADLVPSALHDRVRNISASPFAGWDASELLDVRPLVRALDEALMRDAKLAALPPKFCFSFHGGGERFDSASADLALDTMATEQGIKLHLLVGGVATGLATAPEHATACLIQAAHACLDIAGELGLPARGHRIAAEPAALCRLLERISSLLASCPAVEIAPVSPAPPGVVRSARKNVAHIVPSIPLGRLTALQGLAIARIASDYSVDLRLAPWRGIVLAGVPADAVNHIVAELSTARLTCDAGDGYYGVAACAGSQGCASSHADVRSDAVKLAQRLMGQAPHRGQTINLSGCEKRCAMRAGATVELVAGPSGYTIKIGRELLSTECSPESAIDLAASSLRAHGQTNNHESQLC